MAHSSGGSIITSNSETSKFAHELKEILGIDL